MKLHCFAFLLLFISLNAEWKLHTIDNTSKGADGVRFMDINGDKHPDLVTGWEEGGVVRIYTNPGKNPQNKKWKIQTIAKVKSPEDAVFVDLDNDGNVDVVSSCEGGNKTVYAHWAPKQKDGEWKTEAFPATIKKQSFMYTLPMDIDGHNGIDLLIGAKGSGSQLGWLKSPKDPRDLSQWTFHPLYKTTWVMSIQDHDMDGDGDPDVLISDRKGPNSQVLWLENPGTKANRKHEAWKAHTVGAVGREVMFIDYKDVNGDGRKDVIVPAKPRDILILFQPKDIFKPWETHTITFPSEKYGTSKAVRAAHLDGDGKIDIAVTCEHANGKLSGCFYLSWKDSPMDPVWKDSDIGGPVGLKYDRIELVDIDGDGDLDLFSCEERDQLGVFWYENPTNPSY
jgi:hypothetical protein